VIHLAKGLEMNIIAIMIIGLVSIALLLLLLNGPLSSMIKSTFCFFYENVLNQKADFCKSIIDPTKQITICKNKEEGCTQIAADNEEITNYIAAYSILCWKDVDVKINKNILCYQIILKTHPEYIDEEYFTYIMEKGGGCDVLENSEVVLLNGSTTEYYGNCGTHDNIDWDVSGNFIQEQSLVLIKYDTNLNKIVISA
jgi:hypothetical protein